MSLRVVYRRTGGLAGLELVAEASDSDLDDECTAVVEDLFTDPPPDAPPGPAGGAPSASGAASAAAAPGADRLTFELTISDGETTRSFTWSEVDVPALARPLVDELARRAEPSR